MNRTLALAVRSLLLCAALGSTFDPADAATIRSWDSANQAGGDLFLGLQDNGYQTFRNTLLSRGHSVLPGISELTAANLSGLDVFFWGTSSHVLSASEQTVLSAFIRRRRQDHPGDGRPLPASRLPPTRPMPRWVSAQSILGDRRREHAGSGNLRQRRGLDDGGPPAHRRHPRRDVGRYERARACPAVASSLARSAARTSGSNTRSVRAASSAWPIRTGGTSSRTRGSLHRNTNGPYYNPNNVKAYVNFIETTLPIPEPGTFMLIGSGLVGLAAWRRLTHQSV